MGAYSGWKALLFTWDSISLAKTVSLEVSVNTVELGEHSDTERSYLSMGEHS